ncbi:MAG: DUF6478 family protein [Maritimibacter sp.]
MVKRSSGPISRYLHRRVLRRWEAIAQRAKDVPLSDLRHVRMSALALRQVLDQVVFVADSRLTLPLIGSNAFQKPLHSDWAWRPELWRGPIFPPGKAAQLPDDAVRGLQRRHVIRVNTVVETEKPLEIFVRLNVRHGPNTEQLVRELPLGEDDVMAEFDLAYTKLNEKRVESAWVDVIFERPENNQVILRDVTFSRRPRAEL